MKTIILLIALVLRNLSFGCVILPNGNYIPCETNTTKILIEKSIKQRLRHNAYNLSYIAYDKDLIEKLENAITNIENIKTNIEYNVKLAESRLNEAEVKYVESIKKYKTTLHNDDYDFSKQMAHYEMITAKIEYETARWECGRIYALAKGKSIYSQVGKSPLEIFKLVK